MSIDQSVLDKFEAVVESQRKRIMEMKAQDDFIDYSKLDKLIIGVCGGDGIGPVITHEARRVLEFILRDEIKAGRGEFRDIDGLTIEDEGLDDSYTELYILPEFDRNFSEDKPFRVVPTKRLILKNIRTNSGKIPQITKNPKLYPGLEVMDN